MRLLTSLTVATLAAAASTLPMAELAGAAEAPSRAPATCGGLQVTLRGTAGDDRLVGTAGQDVIDARRGRDRIVGRGGDDIVCGGPGRDRLRGGRGQDVLHGGHGSDDLAGGRGSDLLYGGQGDDGLVSFAGADLGRGGRGHDFGIAGAHAEIRLSKGSDFGVTVKAGALVDGGAGRDSLLDAADFVTGSRPAGARHRAGTRSRLDGGPGVDSLQLLTQEGTGAVVVDLSAGSASAGSSSVTVHDVEVVTGGVGRDVLTGDDRDNLLFGGPRRDTLRGLAGDDLLRGGRGLDTLDGGDGQDTCRSRTDVRVACESTRERTHRLLQLAGRLTRSEHPTSRLLDMLSQLRR